MLDFAKRKICANQLTNIMKGIAALAPTLLLTLILTSCMSDGYTDTAAGKSDTYINLNVSTPTAQARANAPAGSTTGTSGTLKENETSPNPTDEEKIYSIRVWAFKSGPDENAMPIGFKAVTDLSATGSYNVSMKLRKTADRPENIDLYILLNAESIDVLDGNNCNTMTRKALKDATFKSNFGINKKDGSPQATTVPATGLPISRVITNINVKNNIADNAAAAADNPVSVPLVRAVSKLHFYFARKTGEDAMTENVKVTRIEIDGNTFPTESYVFPDEEDYTTAKNNKDATYKKYENPDYDDTPLKLDGVENAGIREVENPTAFIKKDKQTAQEYLNAFKDAGIDSHHLSYLRETNKPITGKIYYQLAEDGSEKFREFTIPSEDKAIRNRELVVYGYFLQGGALCLDLQPIVSDWDDNIAWDYTDKVSIEMEREEGKFGEAVEVHYGIPNGGGPAITLKNIDTGNKNWILQCDNPDFAFYVDGNTYDTVSKSDITGNSFTFYVVPKRNKDLAVERNFNTNVFIVLAPDMRKVLFNVGDGRLPGDDFNIKFTQGDDRSGN